MKAQTIDRRIAELLNDPLTGQVIQADGVDRARLATQLRRVAERLRSEPGRAEAPVRRDGGRPWGIFAHLSSALLGA
jgi:hypothetical protein